MSLLEILNRLFIIIVIISLSSFFVALIYELNNNESFVDTITCEEETLRPSLNFTFTNQTNNNVVDCEQMKKLSDQSEIIIWIVIVFWAFLIRKDLYEIWEEWKKHL